MKRLSSHSMKVWLAFMACALVLGTVAAFAEVTKDTDPDTGLDVNEPGILEPFSTALKHRYFPGMDPETRAPGTDQSIDGNEQTSVHGEIELVDALGELSSTGFPIDHVASPNDDMRAALQAMVVAAQSGDDADLQAAALDLKDILLGTTEGRIYDGFAMLNWNRYKGSDFGAIDPQYFQANLEPGEYKMKTVRDTGETYESNFVNGDGSIGGTRKIWDVDIDMLYYDGDIDADTFLVRFPHTVNGDDLLRVNYKIFSVANEDFSPTLVMLDRRPALNTVQFPFKGFDAVWIAFLPGQVLNVSVNYPPARMVRGVYDWGWRVHPPRIQFMQPVYEIVNAHTGLPEFDPQSESFAYRNREELTIGAISDVAPEMKMYKVAKAVLLDGASAGDVLRMLTDRATMPAGTWFEWADLAREKRQLPPEAWDIVTAEDGLARGEFGDYQMITAFVNNEMYGEGPFLNEVIPWKQGDTFHVKLINLDDHTHYFRNVDFSSRQHDDILRCCGGGETSFEIMNFKPSYGAPKVAEMQWRAGWGFRPHYDILQQSGVFPKGSDRVKLKPYNGGFGGTYYGYQYSDAARGGDFPFNPPPFIIGDNVFDPTWSPAPLKEVDGQAPAGLVIGRTTPGYGTGKFCPNDPFPGFCTTDIQAYNPFGAKNFPPPPLRGAPVMPVDVGKYPGDVYPNEATELRFPPFLRNPEQGNAIAGDIIPPTGAWETFLFYSPENGTIWLDPEQPELGFWADETMAHGAPVWGANDPLARGNTLTAVIELPRASGQVFYQFDDLFHDNDIFSPHPLAEGLSLEEEEVTFLRAFVGGPFSNLKVRGQLSELASGGYTEWVKVTLGGAGENGCEGDVIGTAKVNQTNGGFVLRCGKDCFDVSEGLGKRTDVVSGATVCVESPVHAVSVTTVE